MCIQCGLDAASSPVISIDSQLRHIHSGACTAKLYLERPDIRLRNDPDPVRDAEFVQFLEGYTKVNH